MPSGGLASWRTLRQVFRQLVADLGMTLTVDGAEEVGQTDRGFHIKIKPGTGGGGDGGGDHPFKVSVVSTGASITLHMQPGTINGYDFETADFTVSSGFSGYIGISCTVDLEFNSQGWLTSAGEPSVDLATSGSPFVSDGGGGLFYLTIATMDGEGNVTQYVQNNATLVVYDDGTSSSNAVGYFFASP